MPLPDYEVWANMTVEVVPSDPYGHNYMFDRNSDCDFDMGYMLDFFHDPAVSAELDSCETPFVPCVHLMTAVRTVKYLLDSTTIHKG